MTKPVCQILIPETLDRAFLLVVDLLETLGLSLANPGNGKITTWNDDGDQKVISAMNIVREVASGNVRNVQFWKTASEDVFVSWGDGQDGNVFSIYLDGVDSDLAVMLIAKLAESVLMSLRTRYEEGAALTIKFE